MSDAIEIIGNSLVQHGPDNDRAYLMKLHPTDIPDIIGHLEQLASSRGYSKVCAKVPACEAGRFVAAGFHLEAAIPYFFPEGGSACFMAKYFTADRKLERQPLLVREILAAADARQPAVAMPLPARFALRVAREEDAGGMAAFYRQVLTTRACAVHDPAFIRAAMEESSIFFGAWKGESIVALSCAEVDITSSSAEMTDFATLPEYRGHGVALHLLRQMEEHVLALGIRSVFTVVRAYSFGMNIALASNGYSFGGTLTNDSNVRDSMESANVWHKVLPDDPRLAWRFLFEAGAPEDGRGPGRTQLK